MFKHVQLGVIDWFLIYVPRRAFSFLHAFGLLWAISSKQMYTITCIEARLLSAPPNVHDVDEMKALNALNIEQVRQII